MNELSLPRKWQRIRDCNTHCSKIWPNLIVLRDTDKPLGDTAKDIVYQQNERLDGSNETEIAIPETYENLPQDPNQLKEVLMFSFV
jgi:hypothetical protein